MISKKPEKKIWDYAKSVQNDKWVRTSHIKKGIINVKFQHKSPETAGKTKSLTVHEHCNK